MLKNTIFIFIFLLIGCSNTEKIDPNFKIGENKIYHLLIFKSEQKGELWVRTDKNTFLDSFKINPLQNLPIGEFILNFNKKNNKLKIQFPNKFYQSKSYKIDKFQNLDLEIDLSTVQFFKKYKIAQISTIIIFPNDNRLGGELKACFACPHWMAELYSFLNLKKKEYI